MAWTSKHPEELLQAVRKILTSSAELSMSMRLVTLDDVLSILGDFDATTRHLLQLLDVSTKCKNSMVILAECQEDTSDMHYRLFFELLPELRAVLAKLGGPQ